MIAKYKLPYVIKKERNGAGKGAVPGREALMASSRRRPIAHQTTATLGAPASPASR